MYLIIYYNFKCYKKCLVFFILCYICQNFVFKDLIYASNKRHNILKLCFNVNLIPFIFGKVLPNRALLSEIKHGQKMFILCEMP